MLRVATRCVARPLVTMPSLAPVTVRAHGHAAPAVHAAPADGHTHHDAHDEHHGDGHGHGYGTVCYSSSYH